MNNHLNKICWDVRFENRHLEKTGMQVGEANAVTSQMEGA